VTGGRPAVFLDRDGVLNELWYDNDHGRLDSPRTLDQLRLTDSAIPGLRLLAHAGWPLVVVSNQPGVAKGTLSDADLGRITSALVGRLRTAGIRLAGGYYCRHHPAGVRPALRTRCGCRKPAPGLLLRAARELDINLSRSWMVGDGVNDVVAGHQAGCRCVWVGRWKCEHCQAFHTASTDVPAHAPDLIHAARLITAGDDGRR